MYILCSLTQSHHNIHSSFYAAYIREIIISLCVFDCPLLAIMDSLTVNKFKLILKVNLRKKLAAVESEFAKTLAVTYYRFNLLSFTTQKVSPVKRQKQAVVKPVHAIIL